jgi:hypothetical protein
MTTIRHEPVGVVQEKQGWSVRLLVPEMWACLAIVVMWLAVLFDAIFGPDIVSTDETAGVVGSSTTVPSAVVVALFAFLGTWVVAKHGFGHDRKE